MERDGLPLGPEDQSHKRCPHFRSPTHTGYPKTQVRRATKSTRNSISVKSQASHDALPPLYMLPKDVLESRGTPLLFTFTPPFAFGTVALGPLPHISIPRCRPLFCKIPSGHVSLKIAAPSNLPEVLRLHEDLHFVNDVHPLLEALC